MSQLSNKPGVFQHQYCEVGSELLAKPGALSDILESSGLPSCLVFCNNPSDVDFVEVLLKKRGIMAMKLIGFVPPAKLSKAHERLKAGEISCLVLTDIAARNLDLNEFPLIVNYSIPADSDTYLQRCGQAGGSPPEAGRTVISLASPLDVASFHGLRKGTEIEFTQIQLPSRDEMAKAKFERIKKEALTLAEKSGAGAEGLGTGMAELLSQLSSLVVKSSEKEAIVNYLLKNTLEVMPQLQANLDRAVMEREQMEEDSEFEGQGQGQDRGRRGDRGGPGNRDRGGRDDWQRGGGRGRNGRRDGGRSRQHYDDRGGDDAMEGSQYGEDSHEDRPRRGDRDNRDRDRGDNRRSNRPNRPPVHKIKEDRLYIGHGLKDGLSEDKIASIMNDVAGVSRDQIKRMALRERYSFADLPEELTNAALEKLKDATLDDGKKMFVTRAVTLSTTVQEQGGDELEGEEGFGHAANGNGGESENFDDEGESEYR